MSRYGMSATSDWFPLRVVVKFEEADGIMVFELENPSGAPLPAFDAGAHLEIRVGDMIRHYSLAGSPSERRRFVLSVQREIGGRGGSLQFCDNTTVDTLVWVRGPRNRFPLHTEAEHSVLIAGGIGITPIAAMAEQLWSEGKPFELHYMTRSPARMAFRDRLMGAPYAGAVRLYFDESTTEQRADLPQIVGGTRVGKHLYVCGPGPMIDTVFSIAAAQGWPADRLHCERFAAAPVSATCERAFEVRIGHNGALVPVAADQSIVAALQAVGIDIPVSCEQGICGTCLTGILEGVPDHRGTYLTDEEKAAGNQLMLCCSRAKSDIIVLDL